MHWKKGLTIFLFALLLVLFFCMPAGAEVDIKAETAILIDAATGDVLFELDSEKKWYPASMTKLMTLVVVLDLVEKGQLSLDEKVITSENAASYGGAQLYLEVGEEFTLDDMLKAIILGSANDASVAVAEHVAGSEEAFVDIMNKMAKEIGCKNTHFVNTHGLHHEDHYTTAKDMALIGQYSLRYPKTLEYTSMQYYEFREDPPTARYSLNKLLWWYPGADGFKTGTTSVAKRNLVATASRDGLRLISVVMGVDEVNGHFRESMKLLNYGFSKYTFKQFYAQNTVFGQAKVGKGAEDFVDLITTDNVGVTILKGQDEGYSTKIIMRPYLPAPVAKGTIAGELVIMKDGKELKKYDLVTAKEVQKGSFMKMLTKVLRGVFSLVI
ncbi:D-alanyl-D-alanine carboxypeptidase family protein [Desulfitibacter alkalitolerans]|uniref:D-alanyl-D-alanine carboxypeptidase family protein n=1 Tax=Desulfitibacter alkalitolerans TaxID=264641 RepID=UPI000486232A|nr:D-alanyl-D-alanine carboxypeptidase family protein [Desulfitibacter alkalitolerans]